MDPTKKLEKNSIYALLDRIKIPKKFIYGLYYMRCMRVKHTYIHHKAIVVEGMLYLVARERERERERERLSLTSR
jgi:hypothetical protein